MELKKINEVLENLSVYGLKSKYDLVSEHEPSNYWSEKGQGEESESVYIFKIEGDNYLKLVNATDSYGDNEHVKSVQFVKPVKKTITDFQKI
ncbi:MAG: hypothetical protein CMH22_05830 [Methylophaga sp.]|nr:hypothetical protein [Methylophaga sp.]|tara:strand:+ start:84084 stop:84359 length:276 start_codon:yes stop_codon:yes gene_type:complete